MKTESNLFEPVLAARHAKALGITQEEIAKAVGASQSQVSRILAGKSKRQATLSEKICIYVYSNRGNISRQMVEKNSILMDAIASAWDGSTRQAEILAIMIRAAGSLSRRGNKGEQA